MTSTKPCNPRCVIFTAIFSNIRDRLYPPKNIPPEVELVAFVDGLSAPTKQKGWSLRPAVWRHKAPRLRARRHKLLAHELFPEADYSLWLDGCLTPIVDPHELVARYLVQHDMCLFRHMQRSCLYQELEACVALRKDNPGVMRNQVERYRQEGYPRNHGLAETTALLRRHKGTAVSGDHISINEFSTKWWEELKASSVRDQLSFNYLTWKHNLTYNAFRGNRCRCPYFEWRAHR